MKKLTTIALLLCSTCFAAPKQDAELLLKVIDAGRASVEEKVAALDALANLSIALESVEEFVEEPADAAIPRDPSEMNMKELRAEIDRLDIDRKGVRSREGLLNLLSNQEK